jgi:hypothetical protein
MEPKKGVSRGGHYSSGSCLGKDVEQRWDFLDKVV